MNRRDAVPRAQKCLRLADSLAAGLERFGRANGAASANAERLGSLAARVFPLLIWRIDAGELVLDPTAAAEMALLIPPGLSTAALCRADIPLQLREPLLPLFRPDARGLDLTWWDVTAVPSWVRPYFAALAARSEFLGAMGA